MRQLDEEKPAQQFIDADVFGSDSSDSTEEESPKKFKCCSEEESPEKYKCCTRCDHSDPPSSDDDCDSYDEDNGDGSDLVHTHKQNEQTPHDSEGEIPHEFKILLDHLTQKINDEHQPTEEIEQEVQEHYDANNEHQPTEEELEQEAQEHYNAIEKMLLDLPIVDFCSEICKHDKPPHCLAL
jgi:hypothetical protein